MSDLVVVDASAVVEALLRSGAGRSVERAVGGRTMIAPECLDPEVLSGLRGLERGGHLTPDRAALAVRFLRDAAIARVPHAALIEPAWGLRHNVSAYDAMYVALAATTGCPLVTLDGRLAGASESHVEVILPTDRG